MGRRDKMYLLAVKKHKEYSYRYSFMLALYHKKISEFDHVENRKCIIYKRICIRIIHSINPLYKSSDFTEFQHINKDGNKYQIPFIQLQKLIAKPPAETGVQECDATK